MGQNFTMGWKVSIFMRKMDVKQVRLKCNHGAKYHTVGLAEIAVIGMFHL
jgi:hypothetical protein